MLIVVYGGSGSGKSAYAENHILELNKKQLPLYYLATMQVYGREGQERVEKHRKLRKGKGFITIEQPRNIADVFTDGIPLRYAGTSEGDLSESSSHAVLLECMSNLAANEMFDSDRILKRSQVVAKIKKDILVLLGQCEILVIVTNNVFEDGIVYDEATMEYIRALGEINAFLARLADEVVEVVAGIPITMK